MENPVSYVKLASEHNDEFVTWSPADSNVVTSTVRELLGHKSIKMTLRYAHLSPSHKKQAINLIDQAFGGVEGAQKLTQGNGDVANRLVN